MVLIYFFKYLKKKLYLPIGFPESKFNPKLSPALQEPVLISIPLPTAKKTRVNSKFMLFYLFFLARKKKRAGYPIYIYTSA